MNAQAELLMPGTVEREAAGLPVVRPSMAHLDKLMVVTPWSAAVEQEDEAEASQRCARDQLFRASVIRAIVVNAGWLVPLLTAAGATVVAMPGKAFYAFLDQSTRTELVEIPNLGDALLLLPWRVENETAH